MSVTLLGTIAVTYFYFYFYGYDKVRAICAANVPIWTIG